jgi:translation initiation factor eIF-2B subunit beta
MDSRQIETIEYIVEFKKKLRKKSYPNSTIIAMETARIFKDVIKGLYSGKTLMNFSDLLKVLKSLGKSFISVEPLQFSVGNIVKRILHIVREEYNKFPNLHLLQAEEKQKKLMSMTSLNFLIDYTNQKITHIHKAWSKTIDIEDEEADLNLYQHDSSNNEEIREYVKAILTSITELIDEIESVSDFIKEQSFEHINDGDVILTANHSDQLEEFFIEAAKEKNFHVVIAESAPTLKYYLCNI